MLESSLISALQEQPEDIDTKLSFEFHQGLLYQHEGEYLKALRTFEMLLLHYGQSLTRSEVRFMYEDIQQRRAFLSVSLERFKDAIPLLGEILSFNLEKENRSEALAQIGPVLSRAERLASSQRLFASSPRGRGH